MNVLACFTFCRRCFEGVPSRALTLLLYRVRRHPAQLGIPVTAFVAPQKDIYRKGTGAGTGIGMWKLFVAEHLLGQQPDMQSSFFVGDAAGRAGDHGSGDKDFAQAVGLAFWTPEEAFAAADAYQQWPPLQ